jgi:hypothetical protein
MLEASGLFCRKVIESGKAQPEEQIMNSLRGLQMTKGEGSMLNRCSRARARKIWLSFFVLNSTLLLSMQAQNFKLDWSTVAGGGGTSTGGVYAITGTIGQAEAGVMSGGNYTLVGGFWGIIAAVQTPGAPYL